MYLHEVGVCAQLDVVQHAAGLHREVGFEPPLLFTSTSRGAFLAHLSESLFLSHFLISFFNSDMYSLHLHR